MEGSTKDSDAERCSSELIWDLNSPVTLGGPGAWTPQQNEMLTQFWTPTCPWGHLPTRGAGQQHHQHPLAQGTRQLHLPLCNKVKSLPH